MHSATEAALRKADLIEFIPASDGKSQIKTFQGRIVMATAAVAAARFRGSCGLASAAICIPARLERNRSQ